ncbi:DUF4350 domain-containing protein [Mucilaginibacter sp. FT3.2]|uniref:DUF4350 domain-containing protein n=1 Tax=Mucilaginibacter sp. FT3.2 TaxID=2723090 RepID=UPI001607AB13|nr:DUF4350 domain-containing protein [Mucilaginibacter sp. FT3.2]MBB6234472.1 hypothetical protein [Mucilaginibacter sp. FT3.2]
MKSLKLYLAVLSCSMLVYLIAQYNRPKPIDWTETMNINDKIPFGTYVLYNRINDIFPGAKTLTFREPVYNVINDHDIKHGTYIIICHTINLNEYDYAKLKTYIKAGNDVFIAAEYFGDQLAKELGVETQVEFANKKLVSIKLNNKYLDTTKLYYSNKGIGDAYFKKLDTAKFTVLGSNTEHHTNFAKCTIGKGHLYINANPLMFTNFGMLSSAGSGYVSQALSVVKNDSNLIWDQYYTVGRSDDESSMRVFLRNTNLRRAFYIAFFGLLVFIIYEAKRRQRIIPVIEPLPNSTVEFVSVVGQVYYEQRDNANIARKKATYLLEYLRDNYRLKTNSLDEEFISTLSQKTSTDVQFITDIINTINFINNSETITDMELIRFNKLIEKFYSQNRYNGK